MSTIHEQRIQELQERYSLICTALSELEKTLSLTVEPLDKLRYTTQIAEKKQQKFECERELRERGIELSAPILVTPKQALITEPYKGLSAFTDKDAAIFFGREKYIAELVNKLANKQRFIAVLGASGSGKSSLVRAGLIVKLQQAQLQGKTWRIVQMRPTREPLYELQNRWRDVFPQKLKVESAEILHQSLVQFVEQDALLLVIDQFEEVFTECQDENKRLEFFSVLLGALQRENALHVVITLRADFLGKCIERDNAGLAQYVSEFGVFVLPLSASELHEVIVAPLAQTGKTIESQLVDILIDEASREKGCLPLLQYALEQLWKNARTFDAKVLTVAQYQTLCKNTQAGSGLRGLLNERADAFYQGLSAEQKSLMQWLFLELVQLGEGIEDTRKTLKQEQLFNKHPEQRANIASLLEELTTEQRLLICDAVQEHEQLLETVTVAHEALIRDWGQLREWVNQYRDLKRWREHLEADLQQWQKTKARDRLLQGGKLADAEEKLATYQDSLLIDEGVRGFIKESQVYRQEELARKQKQARNFRNLSTAFVLVAVILSLFSVWQWQKSETNHALSEKNRIEAEQHKAQAEIHLQTAKTKDAEAQEKFKQSLINQSRMLSGYAEIELTKGSQNLAMRLALETLPESSETYPDRPFVAVTYHWLSRAINQQFQGIFGHEEDVRKAVFSPDGTRLLTVSNEVLVWDMQTGWLLFTLQGYSSVLSAAYSPDGTRIVTASADDTARVWDAQTGQAILTLKGHSAWVNSATYSPDGTRIVTASGDDTARVWDAQTGQAILTLGHSDYVYSAAYSPDGTRIVTASRDKTARVWDALTGEAILTLKGYSAAYSPDGTRIVTASDDKTARVWDALTGQAILTLEGHEKQVISADYSPDGTRIVTASVDNTIRMWDAQTGVEHWKSFEGTVDRLKFNDDNRLNAVNYSSDGNWVVVSSKKAARVFLLTPSKTFRSTYSVFFAAYSPDGKRIVTTSKTNFARISDAQTGQNILTLKGHSDLVRSAAYSPDGKSIVTASHDKTARVWDALTGQAILTLEGHEEKVISAAYSPDGKSIVTASDDATARVWDAQTGHVIHILRGHIMAVNSAAYSSDGTRIVTASSDQTARVWNAQTGQAIITLSKHLGYVSSAAYSPNGMRIVTTSIDIFTGKDNSVRLWDGQTGEMISVLFKGNTGVRSAAYSPDGTRIVTVSANTRVWDALTGQQLAILPDKDELYSARFSPDGLQIITASNSENNNVRIWLSFPSVSAMVAHAKKMLPPRISNDKGDAGIENFRLTCAERRQFFLEELERCKRK